jgi:Tfp pilus assembly protein PilX
MNAKQNKTAPDCAITADPAKKNQAAFILVTVLIFVILCALLGSSLLYNSGSQISRAAWEIRYEKAFFIAEAGVELAKARLRNDGVSVFSATTNFGSGQSKYCTSETTTTNAIIWSTGTYQNVSRVLKVKVLVDPSSLPPPSADGAVGVYGTNVSVSASGNALIDGRDYNPPTNFDCNGAACAGTLTTNAAEPGVFSTTNTTVTTSGSGDIIGNPATTNNATGNYNAAYWQDLADELSPQASVTISGTYTSEANIGTRVNPIITLVSGDTDISGNLDGAGIIIVMNGMDLRVSGNFHYEGLLVFLGNNDFRATGTVRIFGALVALGGGETITTSQGTPSFLYSSAALANLQNLEVDPRTMSIIYWKEVRK